MFCLSTAVTIDESTVSLGFAGDNAVVTLTGIDATHLSIGKIRFVLSAYLFSKLHRGITYPTV
jgi:hypothetical protein